MESKLNHNWSILKEDLERKVLQAEELNENIENHIKRYEQDQLKSHTEKIVKAFRHLNNNVEHLCKLYKNKGILTGGGKNTSIFLYEQPQDELFLAEEAFATNLTEYTRKQFFQGLASLVGGQDHDLLDLSKPESRLIKSESEATNIKDREELRRLQSIYLESEKQRINDSLETIHLRKAVETAKQQLEMVKNGQYKNRYHSLKREISNLEEEIKQSQEDLKDYFNDQIMPVLMRLQELQSGKVLQGNYNIKITRQEYFLSKQDELINQLLLQYSRNRFLSTLYEVEYEKHQYCYHLISSVKLLLTQQIENIEKRIKMLADPLLSSDQLRGEIIKSQDYFVKALYDIILYGQTTENELYRSYDSMRIESQMFQKHNVSLEEDYRRNIKQNTTKLNNIEKTLEEMENILLHEEASSSEQVTSLVDHIEENLSITEVQVNDVVKDIVTKRKILANDTLKVMERELFSYFFNDPARLKRSFKELEARLQNLKSGS